jgi:hypothetical protein
VAGGLRLVVVPAAFHPAAAQEAAFALGLGDPDLDPVPFSLGDPPNTDMIKSWASFPASTGPPTSGTHSGTP